MLVSRHSSQNNFRLLLVWLLERSKLALARCQGLQDGILLKVAQDQLALSFSGYDCTRCVQLFY